MLRNEIKMNDYYIEFMADQYQVGKLMQTIGCNFDRMERFKSGKSFCNTQVALSNKDDCILLQAALEKNKIGYVINCHIGVNT